MVEGNLCPYYAALTQHSVVCPLAEDAWFGATDPYALHSLQLLNLISLLLSYLISNKHTQLVLDKLPFNSHNPIVLNYYYHYYCYILGLIKCFLFNFK